MKQWGFAGTVLRSCHETADKFVRAVDDDTYLNRHTLQSS